MADPAGMFLPVNPVRECGRLNIVFLRGSVDKYVPKFMSWRQGWQNPELPFGF